MKRLLFILLTAIAIITAIVFNDNQSLMAVTTLGLFGTGDFETNETPEDWRESILYLFPNGEAPLTAFLSKMKREDTKSVKFHWWEKGLVTKSASNTGIVLAATTLMVLDDTSMIRKDMMLYNTRTAEIIQATADPASATTVETTRGAANTTAVNTANLDEWLVIGTAFEEGSKSGNPIYSGPGEVWNYVQTFKTPLELTNTAMKEDTRTGNKYQDMKEEALRSHSIDMEMGFFFGNRHSATGVGGKPVRYTGGLIKHFITSNRFDASGTLTPTLWNNYMEQLSTKGSMERVLFCGSRFIRVIHEMIQNDTQYRVVTGEKVYGNKYTRLVTPFGLDLLLMIHPLFNSTTYMSKTGVVLDLSNITERTFRDTQFNTDVQDNDADEKKDVFLTETGLEVQHEETHGFFEDFNAFAAA